MAKRIVAAKKSPTAGPQQAAIAKLASSALPASAMTTLHLRAIDADETSELSPSFERRPSLIIPYHGLDGKPRKDGFYRVRYLDKPATFGKAVRYTQPPKTSVAAYFPTNIRWDGLADNTSRSLLITEGELKAASASHHGYPTIGLGGVYSWMSAKHGVKLIPELESIKWVSRLVYLVFDSDYRTNPMVTAALARLADALQQLGAHVNIVDLPQDGVDKVGLDDYIVSHGAAHLEALLLDSQAWGYSKDLWRLNEEVIYIEDPGLVVVQATSQKLAPMAFKDHAYANRKTWIQVPDNNGGWKRKEVSLPKTWIEWPNRYVAHKLTYAPGRPRMFDGQYNTWTGWGCEPVAGDISPWRWLLDRLFGADLEAKVWFERWCAYPIQHPGTKLFSAALLWGREHGTGKSLAFLSLKQIYGPNFSEINTQDLLDNYNDWSFEKQFVLADDLDAMSAQDRRHQAGTLRTMITRTDIRVKIKYVPGFSIPDCVNYGMTSNEPDSLVLDERDRRQFVHEVTCPRMTETDAADYDLWIHSAKGRCALHHHLKTLDLGDFNPSAPAYETSSKRDLISVSTTDLAAWCRMLRDHPDEMLRVGGAAIAKDLLTVKQVKAIVDPDDRVSSITVAKELRRAGFRQVCDGRTINLPGHVDRYYAVRNVKVWLKADHHAVVKHLTEHAKPGSVRK